MNTSDRGTTTMDERQFPNLGALIGKHREPVPITFAQYRAELHLKRTTDDPRKGPDESDTV
jgi:hypothetical protein